MYMTGDGKKFESAVRNAMAAVFNVGSTPYLKKLESEIQIQQIEVCPETFVKTIISYEQRSIYETTRGGEAKVNTDRKHHASEYGLWDVKIDTNDYFKPDKKTMVIPGTTFTEPCPECGSSGSIVCTACEGKGKAACDVCEGSGFAKCPDCSGTGLAPCPKCDGTGNLIEDSEDNNKEGHIVSCPDCNGTGNLPCEHCEGEGKVVCPSCHGSGEGVCKKCMGTGKVKCPSCKGSGSVVTEVEVASETFVKEDTNILFLSALREDMVPFFNDLKPEFDTHQVAVYESSDPIASISTGDFNYRMRETVYNSGAVFDNMLSEIDLDKDSMKVNRYRVNIFQRIFLKITYTFNEKVYLMYYDCGEKQSFLTANPYNDVLQRLADDIAEAYRNKEYHIVAKKLQEFKTLAKTSKSPVTVRNNPLKIAEGICDRFTIVAILGMIIPLLGFLIYYSGSELFAPHEFKLLIMWSVGLGLASIIGHYKTISHVWPILVRQMKLYAAYIACFGIGMILSAMVEGLLGYLIYVF